MSKGLKEIKQILNYFEENNIKSIMCSIDCSRDFINDCKNEYKDLDENSDLHIYNSPINELRFYKKIIEKIENPETIIIESTKKEIRKKYQDFTISNNFDGFFGTDNYILQIEKELKIYFIFISREINMRNNDGCGSYSRIADIYSIPNWRNNYTKKQK